MKTLTNSPRNQKILSTETLVPISFLLALAWSIFYIVETNITASNNQEEVVRLRAMAEKVSRMDKEIGEINGKLDLLIQLERGKGKD